MADYRRALRPGGSYFFTVNLSDRRSRLLVTHLDALRSAVARTLSEDPVRIDAMVILPDHLHTIWTLPEGDAAFATRWRKIKTRFSQSIGAYGARSWSKAKKHERGIWQRRYWEHVIRGEGDLQAHLAYCWWNPVRHGLVRRAADWPHSSFHREVRKGVVPIDWAGEVAEGEFGEPSDC